MDEKRIEELADDALAKWRGENGMALKDALKESIIQAINDTKNEDSAICRGTVFTGYDYPDGNDYAEAILASKVNP